jgi:hypothetical protein
MNALEEVARAIAIGHYARKFPNARNEYVEKLVSAHWQDFDADARLVMTVINALVQQEALEDAQADLPRLPDFVGAMLQ